MKTTLKDIAKRVGVTPQLVSFYLNHPETTRVAEATRAQIDLAIRELDYHPNGMARALITGKSRTIGMLIGGLSHRKRGCFVHALMNAAKARGYHLLVTITNFNQQEEHEALEYMLSQQVDGIVYHLLLDPQNSLAIRMKKNHYPILINEPNAGNEFNTIKHNPSAEEQALRVFASRGRQKICYAGRNSASISPDLRKLAAELHLTFICEDSEYIEVLEQRINDSCCDAILFFSSELAAHYCRRHPLDGLESIISYSLPFEYIEAPFIIGAIYHMFLECAEIEMDRLQAIIQAPRELPRTILLPSEYVAPARLKEIYDNQYRDPNYAMFL